MEALELFGVTCITVGVSGLLVMSLCYAISTFVDHKVKPRVQKVGNYWYIYRWEAFEKRYYEVPHNDWWWRSAIHFATKFHTKEEALANLPPKSPGPIDKIRRKIQYKKIKKEQEDRLKAHKDKMIKVRLDFSDYG